ncbi:MAG: hypothetical protein ABIA37_00935 [Candidatus Woesearchaeota archaeon]
MKWEQLQESWAETLAMFFLLVGFVVALLLTSPSLVYVVIFLCGFLCGRVFYIKRFTEPIFPFILMIAGFLFGYLLGAIWASRMLTALFFLIGFGISYYIHYKKIIAIFKSEGFYR